MSFHIIVVSVAKFRVKELFDIVFKGECCSQKLNASISGFWNFRDFLAVLFTFLGEVQLWFVNLQPRIKVMLIHDFLSVQANSVL